MHTVKFIDYQRFMLQVVQMWFKYSGNNFHVAGTKTE